MIPISRLCLTVRRTLSLSLLRLLLLKMRGVTVVLVASKRNKQ